MLKDLAQIAATLLLGASLAGVGANANIAADVNADVATAEPILCQVPGFTLTSFSTVGLDAQAGEKTGVAAEVESETAATVGEGESAEETGQSPAKSILSLGVIGDVSGDGEGVKEIGQSPAQPILSLDVMGDVSGDVDAGSSSPDECDCGSSLLPDLNGSADVNVGLGVGIE